ncbi:ABHD11-like protein, partial [Tanacetum coccineum]
MVVVDLRNHGRSSDIEGLSPPHDTINAARDIANLVKSLEWAWPDVVIGHSLGGKVALQYALSCAQGDYGDSAKLPKQVWVLDVVPGKIPSTSHYAEIEKALYKLKTLPSPIHSKEWLVDHLINLGFSNFLSEWISSSLKRSGDHEAFYFNIDGVIEMLKSAQDMDYWALLEHPPKGTEIAIVRTKSKLKWDWDLVERLDSLAKRETDESTGKFSVHVVWIPEYRLRPEGAMSCLSIFHRREDEFPQEAGIAKRRLGDVDLGCSNKAGVEADCSHDDLLCDLRKAEHIAKEADSHREGKLLLHLLSAEEKEASRFVFEQLLASCNNDSRNLLQNLEILGVLQDVAADPTLPCTKGVRCAPCGHGEAVFFQIYLLTKCMINDGKINGDYMAVMNGDEGVDFSFAVEKVE